MAFQIKDFASITASMINWCKSVTDKITDFNIGSVVRTMMEATAAEIDELYLNFFIGIKEAIPVSVYNTFGFKKLSAEAASTTLRWSTSSPATAPIVIPAGSTAKVPGGSVVYATQSAAMIMIGQSYVDVLASAQTAGTAGNTGANTITEVTSSINGVSAVTNPQPVTNGRDEEKEEERLTRFQGYISSLAKGTVAAVNYGAKTAKLVSSDGLVTEYVAHANTVEPWRSDPTKAISLVNVYIHNGAGATSPALVARTQNVIDGYYESDGSAVPGWKAAGVKAVVIAASDKIVNVTGTLVLLTGYQLADVLPSAKAAISSYIQNLGVGESVIRSELIAIIKRDVDGIYNVILSAPSADVTCLVSEKAIPGTITLTE